LAAEFSDEPMFKTWKMLQHGKTKNIQKWRQRMAQTAYFW
jgi:hypothetical protein